MSIWKETAIAVPALAALLFVSHAYFGSDEIQSMSVPKTWLGGVTFPAERFIAKELIAGRASNADEDFSVAGAKARKRADTAGADQKRLCSIRFEWRSFRNLASSDECRVGAVTSVGRGVERGTGRRRAPPVLFRQDLKSRHCRQNSGVPKAPQAH